GNAKVWKVMRVIRRTVEGVNDPAKTRPLTMRARFFRQYVIVRRRPTQSFENDGFGCMIRCGNEVNVTFEMKRMRLAPARTHECARRACGVRGDIEQFGICFGHGRKKGRY